MLSLFQPQPSAYDWDFRLCGIPVRVTLGFWFSALLLSSGHDLVGALIWVALCFVSILVHELGHALVMRAQGQFPDILLYVGGGLAIPARWYPERRMARLLVPLAGPAAGFALGAVVVWLVALVGGQTHIGFSSLYLPVLHVTPEQLEPLSRARLYVYGAVNDLLYLSLYWGLLNLLPVWPLDGGHFARAIWEQRNPRYGEERSLMLSIAMAAICAVAAGFAQDRYLAVFFVFFGVGSLQALESGRSRPQHSVKVRR